VSSERDNLRAILLISLAVLCFAVLDALCKYLTRYYAVSAVLWARYAVHVVLLAGVFGPRMKLDLLRTTRPGLQILRALCLLATSLFYVTGLLYVPLPEATAIVYMTPLLVVALSMPMLGEKVDGRDWIAVLLGLLGVLIIVRPGGALLTAAALLPFAAAVCNTLYQVITRKFSRAENPTTTNFITGFVGAIVLTFTLPVSWSTPTLPHALLLVCTGLAGVGGHYLLIKAFARAAPAVLGPFSYAQLLWATLLGYLVFGTLPDAGSLTGMAVIAVSGLYVTYHRVLHPGRRA
jgi:drug/metabolite transporter (DMT)-like permease